MTFQWPEMLWFLAGVPALVGLYVWLMRRRKKNALRYASLSIVREVMRRHGGVAGIRSTPAHGTAVTLRFPPLPHGTITFVKETS